MSNDSEDKIQLTSGTLKNDGRLKRRFGGVSTGFNADQIQYRRGDVIGKSGLSARVFVWTGSHPSTIQTLLLFQAHAEGLADASITLLQDQASSSRGSVRLLLPDWQQLTKTFSEPHS